MLELSLPTMIPSTSLPLVLELPTEAHLPAERTSVNQLVDALEVVDRAVQDAWRLARTTSDREIEFRERAEKAEAACRLQEENAKRWQERYESLEAKLPWWVKKLIKL